MFFLDWGKKSGRYTNSMHATIIMVIIILLQHEKGSVMMLDYLIEKNGIKEELKKLEEYKDHLKGKYRFYTVNYFNGDTLDCNRC